MLELFHYTKTEQEKLLKSMTILVDTREHTGKNDHILNYFDSKGVAWKKHKLDYGDYSFMVPVNEELKIPKDLYFDKEICVERKKDLDEITGNLIKDRERLKREFTLAPQTKVLLIENATFADMVNGKYLAHYDPKAFYASLFSFWHEYNLPVIFMPDADYTGMFIRGYFQYYLRSIIK